MSKKHNDWRLPSVKELLTLINDKKHDPSCDLEDTIPSYYWSSTTNVHGTDYAWYVYFSIGYSSYDSKTSKNYVRCVRIGKKGLEWSKSSECRMTWDEAFEYAENLIAETYCKGKDK